MSLNRFHVFDNLIDRNLTNPALVFHICTNYSGPEEIIRGKAQRVPDQFRVGVASYPISQPANLRENCPMFLNLEWSNPPAERGRLKAHLLSCQLYLFGRDQ